MTALANALLLAVEETPAEEGRKVIIVMLIVGLIFLSVIALGQLLRWVAGRRGRRH